MARIIEEKSILVENGIMKSYVEYAGKSTETKPTDGIISGSFFLEVDTGKIFVFDEDDSEWNEIGG